jgi:hypothetical protein
MPRRPHETPLEFLQRAMSRLPASRALAGRLTSLFEQAKFSRHEIREPMRQEALAALREVRFELEHDE